MKEKLQEASIEPLLHYFNSMITLSEEETRLVIEKFHPRLYRKKQFVLQEGDVCTQMNFVVKGCLRMYKIDETGSTHILQFAAENYWITDLGGFYSEEPSELAIDALEDTMVLQIHHDDLLLLYTQESKFHRIFRVLVENSHVSLQKRLLQTISSTAEDRYQYFINTYPYLINRLPQIQIASFLGMTPEFLSRLRNKMSKPKS
jgi:CRP/FNR family transcriptional regulator, anaerobic regulatory protein